MKAIRTANTIDRRSGSIVAVREDSIYTTEDGEAAAAYQPIWDVIDKHYKGTGPLRCTREFMRQGVERTCGLRHP